jgi:hypothetical protein
MSCEVFEGRFFFPRNLLLRAFFNCFVFAFLKEGSVSRLVVVFLPACITVVIEASLSDWLSSSLMLLCSNSRFLAADSVAGSSLDLLQEPVYWLGCLSLVLISVCSAWMVRPCSTTSDARISDRSVVPV